MDGTGTDASLRSRIRCHLRAHSSKVTEYDAPRELTNEGISAALGMSERQVCAAISVLSSRGLIAKYRRHVVGYRQRKVIYRWAISTDGEFADLRIEEVATIRQHMRAIDEILARTNAGGRQRGNARYNSP